LFDFYLALKLDQFFYSYGPHITSMISFATMKSSLYKIKKKHIPTVPGDVENADEILLTPLMRARYKLQGNNNVESDFYKGMVGTEPHRSLVLAHSALLERMSDRDTIFIDATFFVVPNHPRFRQLLCIQTRYMGVVSFENFIWCSFA